MKTCPHCDGTDLAPFVAPFHQPRNESMCRKCGAVYPTDSAAWNPSPGRQPVGVGRIDLAVDSWRRAPATVDDPHHASAADLADVHRYAWDETRAAALVVAVFLAWTAVVVGLGYHFGRSAGKREAVATLQSIGALR